MSQVVYTHRSGIVVAENHGSERMVADELKTLDPALILTWEMKAGRQVWQVHRWVADDRPVEHIAEWRDPVTQEPLPLSHGLVDLVRARDKNNTAVDARYVSPEEHNRRLDEQADRDLERDIAGISAEFIRASTRGFGHFSGPVKPSVALAQARARGRRSGRSA